MIWRALNIAAGLASARPAAAAANLGYGYYATDTGVLYRSNGTTWDTVGGGGSPTGSAGGDLTGTYPNPTLAAAGGGAAGPVGDTTHTPVITVDAKGRVTALTSAAIAPTGGAPSGSAGGALDGSYPNPGLAAAVAGAGLAETSDVLSVNVDGSTLEINSDSLRVKALGITDSQVAAANKDGTAATASLRTLGTGAAQAAAGNDSRLSDSRAPNGSAGGDLTGSYPNPTLATAGGGAAGPIGSTSAVPVVTVDAKGRVTALTSASPQIDTVGAGTDITTNNVSTSKHGLAPKLPSDATKYLDGTGAYSVPAGGGGGGGGAVTVITNTVLGAAAATIDFSSIAGTYARLIVVLTARGDTAATLVDVYARFNADSGSNYDWVTVRGNNTNASSANAVATGNGVYLFAAPANTAPSGAASLHVFEIVGYADTVFHKTTHTRVVTKSAASSAGLFVAEVGGFWRSTAAINQVTLRPDVGNFAIGTRATLYGVS